MKAGKKVVVQSGVGAQSSVGTKTSALTAADRHCMITTAAYYRAQQRGFIGDQLADWLASEAEIDATSRA